MDINPAGGGMEKEEDGQNLKKKKKVIYTSILPFFFLLHLLPSLVVLYTERERETRRIFRAPKMAPPSISFHVEKKIYSFLSFSLLGRKEKKQKINKKRERKRRVLNFDDAQRSSRGFNRFGKREENSLVRFLSGLLKRESPG
jgi:hypothetical protein